MKDKGTARGDDSASQQVEIARTPLLRTKLSIPRIRPGMVARPRLLEKLQTGTQHALTLVSAPPGFGKTTIVAEWAAQSRTPVAWLSLDVSDNDPVRFLSYLVATLHEVVEGVGDEALALLDASQHYPPDLIVASLLSDVEALDHPIVLVLDDYHVISERALHEILAFLLEHLPPQMRLVLTTRADPPIPLARLRVRRELHEVRADDLRFSAQETALFLKQVMGLDLSAEDIAALEARTEGWIAGLQIAALSMQGRQDLSGFVQAFSGSHRFVLDYLVEEVLGQQPEEVQRFLLLTSILDNITSSLGDALFRAKDSGERGVYPSPLSTELLPTAPLQNSQEILEYLERSNLFLTPLDDERRWYRYHQLFADVLRARLTQADPGLVPELHLRAAGWNEKNGFIVEAVRHAFAAQAYEYAADLIERHGHRRWSLSDLQFLSLVGKLPANVLYARPSLGIYHAWTLFIYGQLEATEALLRGLIEHIPSSHGSAEAGGVRSLANLLLIYIAEMSRDEPAGILPDRQALDYVPEHHQGMRNSADVLYAYLLDRRGDFAASEDLLLGAVRRDVATEGRNAVPICISRVARNWILQGKLKEAAALCREHIAYVRERGERRFFIAGNLYLRLADILCEWNDLDEAKKMVEEGIQANEPWRLALVDMVSHMARARLQQARGYTDEALSTLHHLDELIRGKSTRPDLVGDLRYMKARLWLAKGEWSKAKDQAAFYRPVELLDFRHELDHILLTRLFLADGRHAEALALLAGLAHHAESDGRFGRLLEIRLLQAHALADLKHTAEALGEIEACLALAEPEGYLRVFLDEGDDIRDLLLAYVRGQAPAHAPYASRILQAFAPSETASTGAHSELVEALTPREMEVLALIRAGDANKDIAKKLFITLSAVKKHTGNIYGKLGVSSRTQAIARARQLDLLPPEY